MKEVAVELSTPQGCVFSGVSTSVELRTAEGLIEITSAQKSYLSMMQTTEITLRSGEDLLSFVLENAMAGLVDGKLTVLAESIRPATISP